LSTDDMHLGLAAERVTVRFGGLDALDSVSLKVMPGQRVAVIGPNGAGKSTLINALLGVTSPAAGVLRLDGKDLKGRNPYQRARMGIIRSFQNLEVAARLTVAENIAAASTRRLRRLSDRSAENSLERKRAGLTEMLASFDLLEYEHALLRLCPYGIQKRVELARTFSARPRYAILDEPVAGLNSVEKNRVTNQIMDAVTAVGCGLLLVEHDMTVVSSLADHVYVLDSGRLIAEGTFDEIARSPVVELAYLGPARDDGHSSSAS